MGSEAATEYNWLISILLQLAAANDGVPDGTLTLAATYNKMLMRAATVVQVLQDLDLF